MENSSTNTHFEVTPDVKIREDSFMLIAGPCAVESEEIVFKTASELQRITTKLKIPFIFKASFDKANRTSHTSFRSIGLPKALDILEKVKRELNVPLLTDVHETGQIETVAEVVDVLQVPAFLCRQTDLLQACGKSGLPVNVKKGQFMAPEDMYHVVQKIQATGNDNIALTERGTSFGYHNLVVDMRSLPIMRKFAPVIFDATHSVQMPGGMGSVSGGQREFVPCLARAAAAVGVDGFFIETHPNPKQSLSDGPNMIALPNMEGFLETLKLIWLTAKKFSTQ